MSRRVEKLHAPGRHYLSASAASVRTESVSDTTWKLSGMWSEDKLHRSTVSATHMVVTVTCLLDSKIQRISRCLYGAKVKPT